MIYVKTYLDKCANEQFVGLKKTVYITNMCIQMCMCTQFFWKEEGYKLMDNTF